MSEATCNQNKQKWQDIIAAWKKTDLSVPEWCSRNQVNRSSLYVWLKKIKKSTVKKKSALHQEQQKAFSEIPLDSPPEQIGIEIQCHGVSVRVEKTFDEKTLARVVGVLRDLS